MGWFSDADDKLRDKLNVTQEDLAWTRIEVSKAMKWLEETQAKLDIALTALRKIDEPEKYHHAESDAYTRAGCFQFVAHEARKQIGDVK